MKGLCISQHGARTHQVIKSEPSQHCQDRPLQNKTCPDCLSLIAGQDACLCLQVDVAPAVGVDTVCYVVRLCVFDGCAREKKTRTFLPVVDLEKQYILSLIILKIRLIKLYNISCASLALRPGTGKSGDFGPSIDSVAEARGLESDQ